MMIQLMFLFIWIIYLIIFLPRGERTSFTWCPREEPRRTRDRPRPRGAVEPLSTSCPQEESNLHRKFRKLMFYPLNYEDVILEFVVRI